ncbi:phosphatase PAP2 family protein [Mucilaginibacter sp.]
MKKTLHLLLCLLTLNACAQQVTDTVKKNGADTAKRNIIDTLRKDLLTIPDTVQHLHSNARSLIPPAVLIGYGVTSFYVRPLRRFDRYVYSEAQEHNLFTKSHVEDYFQYAPFVLVYGLNLVGVHGKNTFVDRTLTYVMAQGMMGVVLYTLKRSTHRLRPNGADRRSWPSGHTANAFSGAEFMAQELSGNSEIYSAVGYAFATTTGIFRIYHQSHWFSDVITGAGLGILATKGAYLLYPYVRNTLFKGKKGNSANITDLPPELKKRRTASSMLLPSYQEGTLGLQFSMQF